MMIRTERRPVLKQAWWGVSCGDAASLSDSMLDCSSRASFVCCGRSDAPVAPPAACPGAALLSRTGSRARQRAIRMLASFILRASREGGPARTSRRKISRSARRAQRISGSPVLEKVLSRLCLTVRRSFSSSPPPPIQKISSDTTSRAKTSALPLTTPRYHSLPAT